MEKITTAERILDAAEKELIVNGGFLEMASVASRANVSVGLAYHHFGSKTGMIAATIDRFYGPIRNIALGDVIPVDTEWLEREKSRAKTLIDYYYQHPLAPLVAGRLAREPEILDIEKAHLDALLQLGERNIIQGQKLGIVDADLSPTTTVALLMGGLRLAIYRALQMEHRPKKNELLEQIWLFTENALQPKHNHHKQ
ncbi:TetR family transcriptional regulator [Litorimonas taeanensis]|uniref:TetR family transcriptional regulator n=1 Tax=Litorimonas taeanensis TaxID=568099 RepID=A0A420WCV9_9PROT|nr:TetR/AcrR family transcriptional regulator [Litorimonas taeanensis]RKQ68859.1 TetR family transcriptional regulator [Litorimonas taeanensis]